MDALTSAILSAGNGFASIPAPGDITIGGALAIDAHGTAVPAAGETRRAGASYGSLSHLIQSLTGQSGSNFATAAAAFDAADPYRIFSNTFLDTLLP